MRLQRTLLSLAAAALLITSAPVATGLPVGAGPAWAQGTQSCNAYDNMHEIADAFISRCRKASIRGEFPSEYLTYNLKSIQKDAKARVGRSQTAWYLLTNSAYAKK